MGNVPKNKFKSRKGGIRFPKKKRKATPFYNSQRWRRLSRRYKYENPLCAKCPRLGDHVDHIEPWQDGGSKYDEDNLQTLCVSCHGKKTRKEQLGKNIP